LRVNRAEVLKLWPGEPDDIADSYPEVRVADSPAVIELFNGGDRAKLIALLAAGKINSWARASSRKSGDLLTLDGMIWQTHPFAFLPKDSDGLG
jgi:hypothetical protein